MAATATKPELSTVLAGYVEAWNTNDPVERVNLLEWTVTEDVEFVDPLANIKGRGDLIQHITATRATYRDITFEPRGEHDTHNNLVRAPWLAKIGGTVSLRGIDIDEVAEDGRLSRIIGFFDRETE